MGDSDISENASGDRKRYRILDSGDETSLQSNNTLFNETERDTTHGTSEKSVANPSSPASNTKRIPPNSMQRKSKMGKIRI